MGGVSFKKPYISPAWKSWKVTPKISSKHYCVTLKPTKIANFQVATPKMSFLVQSGILMFGVLSHTTFVWRETLRENTNACFSPMHVLPATVSMLQGDSPNCEIWCFQCWPFVGTKWRVWVSIVSGTKYSSDSSVDLYLVHNPPSCSDGYMAAKGTLAL